MEEFQGTPLEATVPDTAQQLEAIATRRKDLKRELGYSVTAERIQGLRELWLKSRD
ncbi:MAG: hypothetical protein KatS3mg087_0378 [Patescibacteria group bacterium]|nr:MAG: hypothetical protein KatS3mg087_0378 [Patescibacteria group bacterium]